MDIIKKLRTYGEKVDRTREILQLSYNNINMISDEAALCTSETGEPILLLLDNDNITLAPVIQDNDFGGMRQLAYNDTNEHTSYVLVITHNSVYKTKSTPMVPINMGITTLLTGYCYSNNELICFVFEQTKDDISLGTMLKESPITAFASVARIQFITKDNELYGLDAQGNVLISHNGFWDRLDGKELYPD